jgi:hypothetical protein
MHMVRKGCLAFGGLFLLLLLVSVGLPRLLAAVAVQQGQGSYAVVGPPTLSAAFINTVLAAYHSPAAGLGSVIFDQGVRYGIDPVYALAFFWHESGFGTTGEARVTRSPGNERCLADRPCIDQDRGGYALMTSWADGFEHWFRLIRDLYVNTWGRVTVAQIIPKYAPGSDGNDEAAYIAAVEHAVEVWRSGKLWV